MAEPVWIVGIGAMKAGTTTLHNDLARALNAFAIEKESGFLAASPRSKQRVLGAIPKDAHAVVDVSATYSMLPERASPATQLSEITRGTACIVYIIRDPIDRILSQLRHDMARKIVDGNPDDIVLSDSRYVNYSRYSMQLAPWRAQFPEDRIMTLRFEDYIVDRPRAIRRIAKMSNLDLPVNFGQADLSHQGSNRGEQPAVATGAVRKVLESPVYKSLSKSRLTEPVRKVSKRFLLHPPHVNEVMITNATKDELRHRLLLTGDAIASSYFS